MKKAYIKQIEYYLPERIVTNGDIVNDFPEWSVEKIASKVGVNKRHVASKDETAKDDNIAPVVPSIAVFWYRNLSC